VLMAQVSNSLIKSSREMEFTCMILYKLECSPIFILAFTHTRLFLSRKSR
jgi:hypothetical protein